jgi:glycosyltransferase involved in cell wall biosynthesis
MNAADLSEEAVSNSQVEPLLTICVPVFNGERFLAQCLDSLLSQTFRNYVLVIRDNASTDSTAEICQRYVQADSRVRYHRNQVNIGMYGNITLLLRSAQTRYVKLATADDYWSPTMLGDALVKMESDLSLVLCYPKMVQVDQDGHELNRYEKSIELMDIDPIVRFKRVLNELGLVYQLMGVIRTSAIRSTLPFMNQPGADCVYLAELSLYGKMLELPEYQYFRRFHEESSSWNRTSEVHQIKRVLGVGASRIRLAGWKYHFGLIRRLFHSPLAFGPKFKLLLFLGRRIMWDRSALFRELWQYLWPVQTSNPSTGRK